MIDPPAIEYELAEKQQAISAGGLGAILQLIQELDLRQHINRAISLLKFHAPYDEADHVFNIALNLLSGGNCLDHLEIRRTDEAYLNALDTNRIPDPTTAGDFCRRFDGLDILKLMQALNRVRKEVWAKQPPEFFEVATIEADGTMVPTSGRCKEGIGINYKGIWGYHPLVVTLAETSELLYLVNRGGNRPSHEGAPFYLDLAIGLCRQAGFRKIVLRGDTDFSLTEHFDRWDDDGVEFVFGLDAMPNLVALADELPEAEWQLLERKPQEPPKTKPRARPTDVKAAIVKENGYTNKRLKGEVFAELRYQPGKCDRAYRVVVVRKELEITGRQAPLYDDWKYFFYITNASKSAKPARRVVKEANDRCNQENTIGQLKSCGALKAPLESLESNWAYMVIGSLAWSLKVWSGLMIQPEGPPEVKQQQQQVKRRIIRMEFATYCQTLIQIPAQIIRGGRRLVFRLLSYRPSLDPLFLILTHLGCRMRC